MSSRKPLYPGHQDDLQGAHHKIQWQAPRSTNDQGRRWKSLLRRSIVQEKRQLDKPHTNPKFLYTDGGAANRRLCQHIKKQMDSLQRTRNDVDSILLLVKKPDLKVEEFCQLRDLIEKDQFRDCAFDEARNTELWEGYKQQSTEASTREALIAKKLFEVNAKRAGIVATVVTGLLAAAGLATGVIVLSVATAGIALVLVAIPACLGAVSMPVLYDLAKPLFNRLGTQKKALEQEKHALEDFRENSRKQTAKLAEVEIGMIGLCDHAGIRAGKIRNVMKGRGSQTDKIQRLWKMYRTPEWLDSLKRLKQELSKHIVDFEEMIRDLRSEIRYS